MVSVSLHVVDRDADDSIVPHRCSEEVTFAAVPSRPHSMLHLAFGSRECTKVLIPAELMNGCLVKMNMTLLTMDQDLGLIRVGVGADDL